MEDSSNHLKNMMTISSGCLLHLMNGCYYLWGAISTYTTSYFHLHGSPSLSLSLAQTIFIFSGIAQNVGMPFSVAFGKKLRFRNAYILGGILFVAISIGSSFLENFWAFFVVYGLGFSFVAGLMYISPIFVGCKLYPKHKGLVTGLTVSCFGFASAIIQLFVQKVVNPDNKSPNIVVNGDKLYDASIANNFPKAFRVMAIYFGGITVLIFLLFRIKGLEFEPKTETLLEVEASSEKEKEPESVMKELKTLKFWHIFFMNALPSSYVLWIASSYKSFGLQHGYNDEFLTIIGSIGLVMNGSSRLTFGRISDYFSIRKIYIVILMIEIVFSATLPHLYQIQAIYSIYICVSFVCLGVHFSVFSILFIQEYGIHLGTKLYGWFFYSFVVGNAIEFFLNYYLNESKNFNIMFYLYSGCAAISLILSFLFKDKKRAEESNNILK